MAAAKSVKARKSAAPINAANGWLSAAPASIQELIARARVRDELAKLSDNTVVEPELAALFLGVSEATLRRMRDGSGPKYIQPKSKARGAAAPGRNQAIMYRMGALRAWQNGNEIASSMEAAQARGLCFASMSDLALAQPFLLRSGKAEVVISHALATPLDVLLTQLRRAALSVHWLTWDVALALPWATSAQRAPFDEAFRALIERSRSAASAGANATELLEEAERNRPQAAARRPQRRAI